MRVTLFGAGRRISALVMAAVASVAVAEESPARPVELVVPLVPGGGLHTVACLVADNKLIQTWGSVVLVESRPGAGGNSGAARERALMGHEVRTAARNATPQCWKR